MGERTSRRLLRRTYHDQMYYVFDKQFGFFCPGGLVPTDVILGLLKESMEAQAEQAKGFLIDGYPRERRQGKAFEHTIGPPGVSRY